MPAVVGAQATPAPTPIAAARRAARSGRSRWNARERHGAARGGSPRDRRRAATSRGDVAVLSGPLIIGGHVTGNVLAREHRRHARADARDSTAICSSSAARSTAAEHGAHRRRASASTGSRSRYREDGDHIVGTRRRRGERRRAGGAGSSASRDGNWSDVLRVVQAGPYNRVEGLPIELGPSIQRPTPWGSIALQRAPRWCARRAASGRSGSDIGQRPARRGARRTRARRSASAAARSTSSTAIETGSSRISRPRSPRS